MKPLLYCSDSLHEVRGEQMRPLKTLRRIWNDLRQLKNVEAYVVLLLVIVWVVVSSIGIETLFPDEAQRITIVLNLILTALGILIFRITYSEQGNASQLDDYLNDRSTFEPFDTALKRKRQLWIYGASATNIINDHSRAIHDEILNRKDGEIRIIIQNPHAVHGMSILKQQIDENVSYQIQELESEIARSLRTFTLIQGWRDVAGRFEYRLLDFSPGFSMVAFDPDQRDGKIIVEFYGYANRDTNDRMHITLTRQESEHWYNYWKGQFESMWEHATPPNP